MKKPSTIMAEQNFQCPKCGAPIELTQAVTDRVERRLRAGFESKESALRADYEKRLAESAAQADRTLAQARREISAKAAEQARNAVATELATLKEQAAEQAEQLAHAQAEELALRKRARQVEEREKALQVEVERRVDEARSQAREHAQLALMEQQRLKDRERDLREEGLKRQLAVLQQKLEQGSQQAQGDAQEVELEEVLRAAFPQDRIEPIATGQRGADILQEVRSPSGKTVGHILWESKRTKEWSPKWIEKAKADQRDKKADVVAIVSRVLPKGITTFGTDEGVWIAPLGLAVGLATALRAELLHVASVRAVQQGKGEKMELVYEYLTGPQFKARVQPIVEAFINMKEDLDRERRALEKLWARREKQLQTVLQSTGGLVGDLEGLSGVALSGGEVLELEQGEPSNEDADPELPPGATGTDDDAF